MAAIQRLKDDHRRRYWLLFTIAGVFVITLAVKGPIPQDAAYHALADGRTIFGISNFWNVVSNLPFIAAGIAGLLALGRPHSGSTASLYPPYVVFFIGVVLVAFGSSWYHSSPNNSTLVWDRLPMTIAFMAFVAIVVGQHIRADLATRCLPVLVMLGISSVIYWHLSEMRGQGDLRPYVLVQFLPMTMIPVVIVLFPPAYSKASFIWGLLACYAGAKVFEVLDQPIYQWMGISGHTLKHVAVAGGVCFMVASARQLCSTER